MKKALFNPGQLYKVKKSFVSGTSSFLDREILTFESDAYSPYDSSFAYEFRAKNGDTKTWWLPEDEAADSWTRLFEIVSP